MTISPVLGATHADDVTHTVAGSPSATPAPATVSRGAPWTIRLVLAVELVVTTVLYTVGAGRSGWGNSYYAAATQAGAMSWHAFLFGSVDPAGGMSIDKPPASIWLSALAARVFGLSPETVLWPQAACGVAAVALLYATVARQAGPPAGLIAGGLLAITPVATLMARYNNPDELMVLLLVAAAYTTARAVDRYRGGLGWVIATGLLVGSAFLTKLGQALLVVPGLAVVLLVATSGPLWRRLGRLIAGGAAIIIGAGWWVVLVQLTPAGNRPFVGGSTDNSILGLALGYDGLDRLTGAHPSSSSADWSRLFISGGQQAGWLLPASVVLGLAAWGWTRHRPRTDDVRGGLLLWGGWLLGTGIVLSSLKGIYHSYYSVQIAPATAGLVAIGASVAWQRCASVEAGAAIRARVFLAGTMLGSAVWMAGLLPTRASWAVAVGGVTVAAAVVGGLGVLVVRAETPAAARVGLVAIVLLSAVTAPAAVSVATAQAVHHGSGPRAGLGSDVPAQTQVPGDVVALVRAGAPGFRWAAGVPGRTAADVQLATGVPVFELGGYKARDPSPTLAQFQRWVAQGQLHYVLLPGGTGGGGPLTAAITVWMGQHFTAQSLQGWTVVDLTQPTSVGSSARSEP